MVKATEAKIKRSVFKSKQIGWPSFFRDISNKIKREKQVKHCNIQRSINVLRVKGLNFKKQKNLRTQENIVDNFLNKYSNQ